MASPRTSSHDLARMFDRSGQGVFALDEERRIVYFNSAAADWSGRAAAQMLGLECRYHSSSENGPAAVAGVLCPPPEVLAGEPLSVVVCCPTAAGGNSCRRIAYVPLFSSSRAVAGVLGLVGMDEIDPSRREPMDDSQLPSHELHARIQQMRGAIGERYHIDRLLGQTPAMRRARAQVELAAASHSSVLVCGPPGSGRQHVARAIHYGVKSPSATLVPLACSLLAAELLRSTIDALQSADQAHTGERPTLLLNDVDQLPLELQAELCSRLSRASSRLRLIATSRRPLLELAEDRNFDLSLACMLTTIVIELPSLAARFDDLPLLAQLFVEQANAGGGKQIGGLTSDALECLAGYTWPGNLDELQDTIRQAHSQAAGPLIDRGDLLQRLHLAAEAAARPRKVEETIDLEEFMGEIERELIRRAMAIAKENKAHAARLLGMTRPRLYRRLVQLGMIEEGVAEDEEST